MRENTPEEEGGGLFARWQRVGEGGGRPVEGKGSNIRGGDGEVWMGEFQASGRG